MLIDVSFTFVNHSVLSTMSREKDIVTIEITHDKQAPPSKRPGNTHVYYRLLLPMPDLAHMHADFLQINQLNKLFMDFIMPIK